MPPIRGQTRFLSPSVVKLIADEAFDVCHRQIPTLTITRAESTTQQVIRGIARHVFLNGQAERPALIIFRGRADEIFSAPRGIRPQTVNTVDGVFDAYDVFNLVRARVCEILAPGAFPLPRYPLFRTRIPRDAAELLASEGISNVAYSLDTGQAHLWNSLPDELRDNMTDRLVLTMRGRLEDMDGAVHVVGTGKQLSTDLPLLDGSGNRVLKKLAERFGRGTDRVFSKNVTIAAWAFTLSALLLIGLRSGGFLNQEGSLTQGERRV